MGLGFVGWLAFGMDHAQRVVWVMLFVLGFLFLEYRVPRVTASAPFRFITVFGTSSLAAYFLHESILFYGAWWAWAVGLLIAYALMRRPQPWPALAALALSPLLAWESIGRVRGIAIADFFRDHADWPTYWLLLALLYATTFGLVVVTDRVYRWADALAARKA
jgi:hypothetical protein